MQSKTMIKGQPNLETNLELVRRALRLCVGPQALQLLSWSAKPQSVAALRTSTRYACLSVALDIRLELLYCLYYCFSGTALRPNSSYIYMCVFL